LGIEVPPRYAELVKEIDDRIEAERTERMAAAKAA
jgi:hypothetical protein